MTTVPTCEVPGCTNVAVNRCPKCNKVYCVKHMGPSSYTCDSCSREQERQSKKEGLGFVIGLTVLFLIGGFVAFSLNSSFIGWSLIVLGAATFFLGQLDL